MKKSNKDKEILPPTKGDIIRILEEMIIKIEDMPPMGMTVSITHYDLLSVLYVIRSLAVASD